MHSSGLIGSVAIRLDPFRLRYPSGGGTGSLQYLGKASIILGSLAKTTLDTSIAWNSAPGQTRLQVGGCTPN